MQQKIVLKLSPADAADDAIIISNIANAAAVKVASVSGFSILKKSIDARGKNIYINLTVNAFINEPDLIATKKTFSFKNVNADSKKVIIALGKAGQVRTAMVNYIPEVTKEVI